MELSELLDDVGLLHLRSSAGILLKIVDDSGVGETL